LAGSRRERRLFDALPRERSELVVVRDFDFVCITLLPTKANTVLVVYTNTVLTNAVSTQPLKPIAGWNN
jgi:hypothetical protein